MASRKSQPDSQLRDLDIVTDLRLGADRLHRAGSGGPFNPRPPLMALSDRIPGSRLRLTFGRRLDIIWRHAFPVTTSVLLMLLSLAHFDLWGQAALLPTVALTCVWFWSLFRPAAMPPPIVFLIGTLLDLLGFLPLGVGEVTMLATHGIAQNGAVTMTPCPTPITNCLTPRFNILRI